MNKSTQVNSWSRYFEKEIIDKYTSKVRYALVRSTINVHRTNSGNVAHCSINDEKIIKWLN